MNPGEDWAPQPQTHQQRARWAHGELKSWQHCFNDNCKEHRWEKVDARYCPRQVGEKGTLSRNDRREHKKRRAVRTRLAREGEEKTIPEVEALELQISELGRQLELHRPNYFGKGQRPRTARQGEGKTPTGLQSRQAKDATDRGNTRERMSLASWDRCKRGKGANVANSD